MNCNPVWEFNFNCGHIVNTAKLENANAQGITVPPHGAFFNPQDDDDFKGTILQ